MSFDWFGLAPPNDDAASSSPSKITATAHKSIAEQMKVEGAIRAYLQEDGHTGVTLLEAVDAAGKLLFDPDDADRVLSKLEHEANLLKQLAHAEHEELSQQQKQPRSLSVATDDDDEPAVAAASSTTAKSSSSPSAAEKFASQEHLVAQLTQERDAALRAQTTLEATVAQLDQENATIVQEMEDLLAAQTKDSHAQYESTIQQLQQEKVALQQQQQPQPEPPAEPPQ